MRVTFSNGTTTQKQLVTRALDSLLSFDCGIDITVEFVADPAPGQHNEFAYSGGSGGTGSMKIKIDAPDFPSLDPDGESWSMPFFNEVVIHELAHVVLGNLSATYQAAIAALFGTTPASWNPLGSRWEDRPLEGICETFKDAFLPPSLRRYYNRTNHRIDISQYPEFRRLFRDGVAAVPRSEGWDHDVLELDEDDMETAFEGSFEREDMSLDTTFGVWRAGYDLFSWRVNQDFTFEYRLPFDLNDLPPVTEPVVTGDSFFAWRYRITVRGRVIVSFRGGWYRGRGILGTPVAVPLLLDYYRQDAQDFDFERALPPSSARDWLLSADAYDTETGESDFEDYWIFEDAKALGLPDIEIAHSTRVRAGDLVTIHARALAVEIQATHAVDARDEILGYLEGLKTRLPRMPYFEAPVAGVEIELPTSEIGSTEVARARRRVERKVVGTHFEQL